MMSYHINITLICLQSAINDIWYSLCSLDDNLLINFRFNLINLPFLKNSFVCLSFVDSYNVVLNVKKTSYMIFYTRHIMKLNQK